MESHTLSGRHTPGSSDLTLHSGGIPSPRTTSVCSLRLETSPHDHVMRGLPLQEEHSPGESQQSTSLQTGDAMSQIPEGEPLGSTSRSPAGQPVKSRRPQAIAALRNSHRPAGKAPGWRGPHPHGLVGATHAEGMVTVQLQNVRIVSKHRYVKRFITIATLVKSWCMFVFYFFFGPSTPTLLHAAVALGPRRTGYPSHCALESRKNVRLWPPHCRPGNRGKWLWTGAERSPKATAVV